MGRTMVLVEGRSDQIAVETLAARRERDLGEEGVEIVALGGATNFRKWLGQHARSGVRLAGLCDAGEERAVRRGLEVAGIDAGESRADVAAVGFFVCVADLEDELIRALGCERVEQVIDAQGELRSLRTLQKQPAQRERSLEAQLRRFMGTRSRRKERYARLLVDALDLECVPEPLDGLLAYV